MISGRAAAGQIRRLAPGASAGQDRGRRHRRARQPAPRWRAREPGKLRTFCGGSRVKVYTHARFVDRMALGPECRADVLRRRTRPVALLVQWASLLVPVLITATGWLLGKPLTPELLAALGTLTWWAARSERRWQERLSDHRSAIRSIAASQEVPTGRVETGYGLVERQIEQEKRRMQALPPGRRPQ